MIDKKYAVKEGVIYGAIEGLLNIGFASDNDARLCCELLNRKEKRIQEYIDELDSIFKWHKEHYGKSVLDERMGFKSDCEKENEQLKEENKELQERNNRQAKQLDDLYRLIEQKDWRALTDILDDFKRNDEQLQKEWKCYE